MEISKKQAVFTYRHWYKVTKINPEWDKNKLKVGELVSSRYKKESRWEIGSNKTGKIIWWLEAQYLGRVPDSLKGKELSKELDRLVQKLEERKIIPQKTKQLTSDLITLFTESWQTPMFPLNGFREWVGEKIVQEDMVYDYDADGEPDYVDVCEAVESYEIIYTLLYLFEEGYLKEKHFKKLLKGRSFKTSCYGDYIDRLRSFGLNINEK